MTSSTPIKACSPVSLKSRRSSEEDDISAFKLPYSLGRRGFLKAVLFWSILAISIASLSLAYTNKVFAQEDVFVEESASENEIEEATALPEPILKVKPTSAVRPDLTKETEEILEPLEQLLEFQRLGSVWPANPIKYAIRNSINAGVPVNTIVLLLLLPGVAALIAAARHFIGLRGFGIFLPAALSVVFVATGPLVGIGLFLVIVIVSTSVRMGLRKIKLKLQYLPRMAMILLFVVLGVLAVLFMAPVFGQSRLSSVSIFPVLILVLLAEDFSKVQLGKSAKTAINLTTETLILALVSFIFLTLRQVQGFVLLNPEIYLLSVLLFDFLMGKYIGLRFRELWRFRKLISG